MTQGVDVELLLELMAYKWNLCVAEGNTPEEFYVQAEDLLSIQARLQMPGIETFRGVPVIGLRQKQYCLFYLDEIRRSDPVLVGRVEDRQILQAVVQATGGDVLLALLGPGECWMKGAFGRVRCSA